VQQRYEKECVKTAFLPLNANYDWVTRGEVEPTLN